MNSIRFSIFAALVLALISGGNLLASESAPGDDTHALAGIGIVAGGDSGKGASLHDHLVVVRVLDNGPAAKIGIKAGDEIIEIDGAKVAGMSVRSAVQNHLRGPLGSVVKVTIVRPGEPKRLSFDMVRDIVPAG